MEKKRLVLADTKKGLMEQILLKVLAEQSMGFDVELLNDSKYIMEFFSAPQEIDLLVVGEELLPAVVHKAGIRSAVIISDTKETSLRDGIQIVNRKENFNELFHIMMDATTNARPFPVEKIEINTKVVLFYSPVGGTGKTCLSLAASRILASSRRVLYINATDINDFQVICNAEASMSPGLISLFNKPEQADFEKISPFIVKDTFSYLMPLKMPLISMGLSESAYPALIQVLRDAHAFDLILVDTNTHFDYGKINLLQMADEVVVLTEGKDTAIYLTNSLLKFTDYYQKQKKYIFIENGYRTEKASVKEVPKYPVGLKLPFISCISELNLEQCRQEECLQTLVSMI